MGCVGVVDCPTQLSLLTWNYQFSRQWRPFKRGGVSIKKNCAKKVKHLLKMAICAGRQSHPQNKEQAFYCCVKCLEPPYGQEKTFGRGVRSDVQ